MNLKIKIDEQIIKLHEGSFNQEETCIIFETSDSEDEKYKVDYNLEIKSTFEEADYLIYFFYNNNFVENDIYQVYENSIGTRIGWTFPLQALLSNNHDYSKNEHFLNYAFVAFRKLLLEEHACTLIPEGNSGFNFSLGDFYNVEDTILVVLKKELISGIEDFDIMHYLPFLYSKGYYYNRTDYKISVDGGEKRLNLIRVAEDIRNDEFIMQLFEKLLLQDNHHLVRFYLLYQVIELLIEKIFKSEFTRMLESMKTSEKSLFQIKDELGNIAKEKQRIKKLFNFYTSEGSYKNQLIESCNRLLKSIDRKEEVTSYEALYSVRNLFVHEYRSIPNDCFELIDEINDVFENLIIEMSITLKKIY